MRIDSESGDGRRVRKSSGKLYWYSSGSTALHESDASGNMTDEFIFFAGARIARRNIRYGVSVAMEKLVVECHPTRPRTRSR